MQNSDSGNKEYSYRTDDYLPRSTEGSDLISRPTFRDIGEFTVSSDPYGHSLESVNLTELDILNLPHSATVVDSGSGIEQGLAKRLLSLRPDLKTIVIDPTLALAPNRTDVVIDQDGDDKVYYYIKGTKDLPLSDVEIKRYQYYQGLRLSHIPKGITISTVIAPYLNIANNSIDLFIDSKGPGMYLEEGLFRKYLSSIQRVLKENSGEARIYPLGFWSGNPYQFDKESYYQEALRRVKEHAGQIPGLILVEERCFRKQDGLGIVLKAK